MLIGSEHVELAWRAERCAPSFLRSHENVSHRDTHPQVGTSVVEIRSCGRCLHDDIRDAERRHVVYSRRVLVSTVGEQQLGERSLAHRCGEVERRVVEEAGAYMFDLEYTDLSKGRLSRLGKIVTYPKRTNMKE